MNILKLPHWVLVNKFPAKFDDESLTVLEQTARLYAKVNELIDSYNKYVEEINTTIATYQSTKDADVDAFLCSIKTLTDNYINTVDLKIAHQDRQIAEIYTQFKDDVLNTIRLMISDLKQSGELDNAILTALDGINTKVDNFIVEMNKKQAELEADYTAKKTALENDYANTKASLDSDYQSTKDALGVDYAAKKTALENDYANTKASLNRDYQEIESDYEAKKTALNSDYTAKKTALENDYTAKKNALNSDYQSTKNTLEADYTTKKQELESAVVGYTSMYTSKGVKLYTGTMIPHGTASVPIGDLYGYSMISVECGNTKVLCNVTFDSNGTATITGVGNPKGTTGMTTDAIFIGVVQLTATFSGGGHTITNNNSYVLNIKSTGTTIGTQAVGYIVGIV